MRCSGGAVNHVVIAIVEYHGLMHSGRPMGRAQLMAHLQGVYQRNPPFANSLIVVGELHGHFYNKHMDLARHAAAMQASRTFLMDLLSTNEARSHTLEVFPRRPLRREPQSSHWLELRIIPNINYRITPSRENPSAAAPA